jgi:hypothetical protein
LSIEIQSPIDYSFLIILISLSSSSGLGFSLLIVQKKSGNEFNTLSSDRISSGMIPASMLLVFHFFHIGTRFDTEHLSFSISSSCGGASKTAFYLLGLASIYRLQNSQTYAFLTLFL